MEKVNAIDFCDASIIRGNGTYESAGSIHGKYFAECYSKAGELKWKDTIDNVVMNVGRNLLLDSGLSTAVTVVGPYMGLVALTAFSTIGTVVDTMSSHAGWVEAGITYYPQYTTRKTCVWSAASAGAKALSAALSFAITAAGTCKGCFIVTGTGATATVDSATGTLFSAGLFTGGDKALGIGDTLQVSYTVTMS